MKRYFKLIVIIFILMLMFFFYIRTMYPAFRNDDSPETIVSAYTLGISHAPGYPLFNLLAKIFLTVPAGSTAFRINLFSGFLSLFVLLLVYFSAHKISGNGLAAVYSMLILGVSPFFWNQAISAKGAIYILNSLLTVAILYSGLRVVEKYDVRFVYLAFFCFGLSLANQWPSAVEIAPVWLWIMIRSRKFLNGPAVIQSLFFLFLGLTPYLYLPIRAHTNPVFAMGDPSTFEGFIWMVMRKGYVPSNAWIFKISYPQILLVLKETILSLSFFWIFSILGIVFMRKRTPVMIILTLILLIPPITAALIDPLGYSASGSSSRYFIDIFLLPAIAAGAILSASAVKTFLEIPRKGWPVMFAAVGFVLTAAMGTGSFLRNDNSRNFLSYDYGKNILGSMDRGSIYIADVDANIMPVLYEHFVARFRSDVTMIELRLLGFDWEIGRIEKETGVTSLQRRKPGTNTRMIVEYMAGKHTIYASYNRSAAQYMKIPFEHLQFGAVLMVVPGREKRIYDPFAMYSFRGLFDKGLMRDPDNYYFARAYSGAFVNTGNDRYIAGDYISAAGYYKKALALPATENIPKILDNLEKAEERARQ